MPNNTVSNSNDPVDYISGDTKEPEKGVALCLSGGGYRAMVFHVGVVWRLYEAGLLGKLDRISSVSGGSITAAALGLAWNKLNVNGPPDRALIEEHFVKPIRKLSSETIDVWGGLEGLLLPGSINDKIQGSYDKYLYGEKTLQDLPDEPRFVINATNVQSGALWRFSKPYMRDYRVGEVKNPTISLAAAVGASSAFPPVLSPMVMKLDPASFTPGSGDDLQFEPYTSKVVLSDGGVYDNLGLETAWKRYDTVLVSDAGGKMQPKKKPRKNWAQHSYRVLDLIDNQVRSLRYRQLIQSYETKKRKGAYWGIRTDIADYELADLLPCPIDKTSELAAVPTRLKKMDKVLQKRLINWGYAVCDASIRKYVDNSVPKGEFPYPNIGV